MPSSRPSAISEASSSEEAYKLYGEIEPDVVVLDVSMPGMGGIEGLRRLRSRYSDARVLLLSMYDDPAFVARAMKMGAMGYISKNSAAEIAWATVTPVSLSGRIVRTRRGRFLSPPPCTEARPDSAWMIGS